MVKSISMLVLSLIASGIFACILIRFLRRLNVIEEEMWGEKARASAEALNMRRQRAAPAAKGPRRAQAAPPPATE